MRTVYRLVVLSVLVIASSLAGCGGGGSSTTQTTSAATNTTTTTTAAKASDYTGSWTGTYAAPGGTATPVTISLVGTDVANTVTGKVYSANLAGTFTGAVDNAGNIAGTVANMVDGHSWNIQLGILGNVVTIIKATYGAASLGTGSCTTTPALTVDMSGSWKGTINQMNVFTGFTIIGTTQNVDVELAYDGAGGFIGAIVSDQGLAARVRFQPLAGYWACYIDQASAWGSMIPAPQYGTLLTEGMITSTAVMQQSFAANSTSPAAMAYINLSDTYFQPGNSFTSYTEFLMNLTR